MDFVARLVTQRCTAAGVAGFRIAFRIDGQIVPLPNHADTDMAMLLVLYADDLVLLADSAEGLNTALVILEQTSGEWGMTVNYDKTKVVQFGISEQQHQQPAPGAAALSRQQGQPAAQVYSDLQSGRVEHVGHFRYLGSILEDSVQQERELNRRIQLAGVAFHQLSRKVFDISGVTLDTKMQMYKAVVVPILLYGGAESWAPTEAQLQRLNACNTTWLRRILHIRRGPHMMSNALLYALTKQPAINVLLRKHRLRWLGHIERMPDTSRVKRLLHATAPSPAFTDSGVQQPVRLMGGPRNTWNRRALLDLRLFDKEHTWPVDCQDRDCWRLFVNHSVLTAAP